MERSVVVTGAGQGIGRAIIERLVKEGWQAVGIERDEGLASRLEEFLGDRGETLVADVADRNAHGSAADAALRRAPLRGWVNNAGIATQGSLHQLTEEDARRVFAVNIEGGFWGCSAALRVFIAQGEPGAIVNVSSIHGRVSFAGHAAYDASKGAIDALTRNVAVEYGAYGIRANAVAPGAVWTPLLEQGLASSPDAEAHRQLLEESTPVGRIAEASEVAAVVAFLLSDDASYVSGQSIAVDGGWTVAGAVSAPTGRATRDR